MAVLVLAFHSIKGQGLEFACGEVSSGVKATVGGTPALPEKQPVGERSSGFVLGGLYVPHPSLNRSKLLFSLYSSSKLSFVVLFFTTQTIILKSRWCRLSDHQRCAHEQPLLGAYRFLSELLQGLMCAVFLSKPVSFFLSKPVKDFSRCKHSLVPPVQSLPVRLQLKHGIN